MPVRRWIYNCPSAISKVTLGTPVCEVCGQPGKYDGQCLRMIEGMCAYCRQSDLKPIGPHQPLSDMIVDPS